MILQHPLSDQERAFLDRVSVFARDEVMPHADRWDHDEQLPRDIFTRAGEIGMMGMAVPEEYGGQNFSYVTVALAIKELGKAYAALAMDIAAHNALAVGQINRFGSDEQKGKYLPAPNEWRLDRRLGLNRTECGQRHGRNGDHRSLRWRHLAGQWSEEIHHQRPDGRAFGCHGHDR